MKKNLLLTITLLTMSSALVASEEKEKSENACAAPAMEKTELTPAEKKALNKQIYDLEEQAHQLRNNMEKCKNPATTRQMGTAWLDLITQIRELEKKRGW